MKKHMKKVGRILFGSPFIMFGLFHLMGGAKMGDYVPSIFPGPGTFYVYLSGLILLAGGLSIVTRKYVMWAGEALAVLLILFILTIHLPGLGAEGAAGQMAMTNLLKDLALLGGVIMIKSGYGKNCSCGTCANCMNDSGEKTAAPKKDTTS